MGLVVKNLNFTRYIYGLTYACGTFNEFKLIHRTIRYSTIDPNRFDLSYRVAIEPFKGINTNTKGAKYYFAHWEGNRMKDLTGLRSSFLENVFFGDLVFFDQDGNRNKVLLLFQILPIDEQLIVDVFDSYYPKNKKERNRIIDRHPWYKKSTI